MTPKRNTIIESLGVYLPPKVVPTRDVMRACRNTVLYPLERLTGIKFRRMAGDNEFSIDLARKAIASCLERSKYQPGDIDLLICCNISRYDGPNFQFSFEPSTSAKLRDHFGLVNAICFDISNACAGMFTGVTVADGFIKAGAARNALVVSGEYITHLTRTAQQEIENNEDDRVACLTLGDSGAAVVLEPSPDDQHGFHDLDLYTLGRYSEFCIARPTEHEHGGAIMFTESIKIHAVAIKESVMHLGRTLKKLRWPKQSISHVIMHQTARTAISELARQVNQMLREEVCNRTTMVNNLAERGNTSTTSHFVAIWDNILRQRIRSEESVVFAIQASGITIGTAPYTFDNLPDRLRTMVANKQAAPKLMAVPPKTNDHLKGPRIRIESIGLVPDAPDRPRDSIELARLAGEACFANSAHERGQIDLLLNAGVHRNEFICEPAIAALIAGKLRLNDVADGPPDAKTLAFDIFNGAVGFLDACFSALTMIKAGKHRHVMVVTSEIENNADIYPDRVLNLKETGSALILEEDADGTTGFGAFAFRYFTQYIDRFVSSIGQNHGINFLRFFKDPDLERLYLDCIPQVVREVLAKEKLELHQITAIFPPQISSDFIAKLGGKLSVAKEKMVDIALEGKDFFTSSMPFAVKHAQESGMVKAGDIGLIINVGTGIQVACAIYYF